MNIQCDRMNMRPGVLVLADGSEFEGELFGAERSGRRRRGRVQHGPQRLPGGAHRPELRRADRHVHQPAHRQLRGQRHRLRVPWSVLPRRRGPRPRPPHSNRRAEGDLDALLRAHGIAGITGIDTRRLTRLIRTTGAVPGAFGPADDRRRAARRRRSRTGHRRDRPRRHRHDGRAVHGAGRQRRAAPHRRLRLRHQAHDPAPPRHARDGRRRAGDDPGRRRAGPRTRRHLPVQRTRRSGVRRPAPRTSSPSCSARRCRCSASASAISCWRRRSAATTVKLPFGHHGANHPVQDLATGRIEITSQNHNFAVAADDLPAIATMTHVNLNDGVCEGLEATDANAFSVQHHPEAGPGPHDSAYLFERFAERMRRERVADATARRHRVDPRHRLWPDRHRSGVRVRLLGTQACRVLREEGYRVILANSNPATIMTDPDFADRTYIEPLTRAGAGRDHRTRAARRRAADARRADRAQPRHGAVPRWCHRCSRDAGDARRRRRGDRHGRRPRAVQGGDGRHRPRRAGVGQRPLARRGARRRRRDRAAGDHPPGLHPRRSGHRASPRPPRSSTASPPPGWRPARSARSSSSSRSPGGRSSSSR